MGKGSENKLNDETESNATLSASKPCFSWEEVKKHNKKDDCWIVVQDNVYNMTTFQNKHPGGRFVIKQYAGQDATEVFNAFHKEFDKVDKYAKLYLIGKVQPNSQIEDKTERERMEKEDEIRKDFLEVKQTAVKMGLFNPSYMFFFLHGLQIVLSQIAGYYILLKYGCSLVPFMFALFFHVIAQGQTNWAQHDYGHSSFAKKPKVNRFIHLFFIGCIKGASSSWWIHLHNQHHAKPNVINKDPDVRIDPVFVLGNQTPLKVAEKNATKKQKFLYPYSIQHYLFPFAAAALFPFFFQFTTIKFAIEKRRYWDLASMVPMYLIHFGVTTYVFDSFVKAILYFLLIRLIESSWFTWVAQSNHVVMDIHDDVSSESWLNLQLRATCNLEKSWFNDWFTGHLNFQIEHHLFPTMPRHNLYKIQPLVMSLCKKHNIPYVVKPMGQAFLDILLSLKKSGLMWQEAYDELTL